MSKDVTGTSDRRIRWRLIAIVVYVILSIALYFILTPLMADRDQLHSTLEAAGVWGVLLYIALYSAQMFVPWLPGAPLDIIGGAVFGFWETNFLSTFSATTSGLIIYVVVRRIGLEKIVERFPDLLESPWKLVKIIQRRPLAIVAVNMLTGDVAYFVAGAAKISVAFTLGVLAIMRVPSVMVGSALGAGIISNVLQQKLDIMVTVASIGTVVALSIGFAIARRFLPGWLKQLEAALDNDSSN
ncbi:MAG: hypothetical protein Kow0077_32760 [Anaerolineae bacterium]